ncbi:MAG: SIS domain-containing protein [Verrucomicrobiae bacterium]|nr:SIS domain-containing protein [Verrucomicrobiae bacterium]
MQTPECEAFLKVADQFQLGSLSTEQPHPLTANLSYETQNNLPRAISLLKEVDEIALEKLQAYASEIAEIGRDVEATLTAGNRIFLCGCGATGRLSISLEVFSRSGMLPEKNRESVISFMAGGDTALTKTIEKFEDYPEYGARQLTELGFGEGDLLISTTEGGETPFVIGATEAASAISKRKPWFLFCNPVEDLLDKIERSDRILRNPGIRSLSLFVGPMGLSGSTRMQASTVLMAAVAFAICFGSNGEKIAEHLKRLSRTWKSLDLTGLDSLTRAEAAVYQRNEYVIYETETAGVTVLTDTTERAPTFSLPPFENEWKPAELTTWCYLCIPSAANSLTAWKKILLRPPRCLEWENTKELTGIRNMTGFYVGGDCHEKRRIKTGNSPHHVFKVEVKLSELLLRFQDLSFEVQLEDFMEIELNLLLKMILNIHSTALMGIMERYESNLMTFVRPTNYKLIDRTIRYVQRLNELQGNSPLDYFRLAEKLFEIANQVPVNEPMVLRLLENIRKE